MNFLRKVFGGKDGKGGVRNSLKWSVYISHWLGWTILYALFSTLLLMAEDSTTPIETLLVASIALLVSLLVSLPVAAIFAIISYWCSTAESKCLLFLLLGLGGPFFFGSVGDLSLYLFGRRFYTGAEDLPYFWRNLRN